MDDVTIPAQLLRLGAITVVFYCLSTVTNSILQGLNKMTAPVKHGAISLVIHLVALLVMLVAFKWKIYALVFGNIVFSFCMCILNARALRKAAGYHQEVKKTFLLPASASVIMGICILITWNGFQLFMPDKLATIFTVIIAIAVYGVSLLKMGALSSDEIVALPKGTVLLSLFRKLYLIRQE